VFEARLGGGSASLDARLFARDLLGHLFILGAARFEDACNRRIEHSVSERLPPLRLPVAGRILRRQGATVDVVEVMHDEDRFE
jgi:hypothetical protein